MPVGDLQRAKTLRSSRWIRGQICKRGVTRLYGGTRFFWDDYGTVLPSNLEKEDFHHAIEFETVHVWRRCCHVHRNCNSGICFNCFNGRDYVSVCIGLARKMESKAFIHWWQETGIHWFGSGSFRPVATVAALNFRDSWYLFILGWATNSKVEMGAHWFSEFLNFQADTTGGRSMSIKTKKWMWVLLANFASELCCHKDGLFSWSTNRCLKHGFVVLTVLEKCERARLWNLHKSCCVQ